MMNSQKLSALLYVLFGAFLIVFFGGTLIVQFLGIVIGLLMVRHGFMLLGSNSTFHSFSFFSQNRYR